MRALWQSRAAGPSRHPDPNAAIAGYLQAIRKAEVAGMTPPPAALNGLGDAYLDLGDEAIASDHHLQAAEAYATEGLYDNAVACCRKVLRRNADHARAGLLLGRYYAAKGLKAEALEVLSVFAGERSQAGHPRDEIAALEEIVRIVPYDARLRERLGRLLQEAGRREDALREYRVALEICLQGGDPAGAEHARTRIEALEGGGTVAGRPGDRAQAEGGAEPAPIEPDLAAAGRRKAREHFTGRRWREAAESYRRLAAEGAMRAEDFAAWAEAARQSGRAPAVLEALEAAAAWHMEGGQPMEARRAAEEMLLIDPESRAAAEWLQRTASLLAD